MLRTTPASFIRLCVLSVATGCLIAGGCRPRVANTVVTPQDQQVATECAQFIEQTLKGLPDDHPLVLRYGRYASMTLSSVTRNASSPATLGGHGFPANLQVTCQCLCEKYPASIGVTIVNYNSGKAVQFFTPEEPFAIAPLPNAEISGVLSDCKPVLRGDQLWFVREGGDMAEIVCQVSCILQHPRFRP